MEKNGVALLSIAAELSRDEDITANEGTPSKPSRRSSSSSYSSPKCKLVLPDMTPDVRMDLESGRLSGADLPLSIAKRQEWLEYPLKDIAQPHSNDVCKFWMCTMNYLM